MTDTVELEKLIAESGIKKSKLAEKLNIGYQSLKRKINNEVPFNASEILILCNMLGIKSLALKEAIFFANRVDKSSTKA